MSKTSLDQFGEVYISEVRDDAIIHWKDVISGNVKAPHLIELSNLLNSNSLDKTQLLLMLIPKIVDSCLSRNLRLFEQHPEIELSIAEENLVEASDGIVGELFGTRGWIARFSTQAHDES